MALHEELERDGNWLFKRRSYLPIGILVIGYLLYLQREYYSGYFFLEDTSYEIYFEMLAVLISLLGLFIRIYTIGYTFNNTSGRNTKEGQVADALNVNGIYSIVRHPLYVGNFLMWLGPALWTANFWFIIAFCLFYWIYYERIMYAEEQFLRKKFAHNYLSWSSNVPAFIPKFKNFKKPSLPFNWKKVLKKEKNGFFALFLIFTFFDISGVFLEKTGSYNFFLITMCLLSGLSYIVIKFLRKYSILLNE